MKYCTHCGVELLDEAVVCPKCGYWTSDQVKVDEVKPKFSVLSLVGFILSLVAVVFPGCFLVLCMVSEPSGEIFFCGLPFAVAGLVCSIVGLVKTIRKKQRGKGFAIAGMIIGAIVAVSGLLLILLGFYLIVIICWIIIFILAFV